MKLIFSLISLLVIFYSSALFSQPNDTCKEIYLRQQGFFSLVTAFKDEIAFIDALKEKRPENLSVYQKYAAEISILPFSMRQSQEILRVGFNEQIFCNPWPLKLPIILEKLKNGEFSNSLLREIERLKNSVFEYEVLKEKISSLSSPFPSEIIIRDKHHDFTSNFFYYLRKEDGKIFIKPNPRKGNKANIIKSGVIEGYRDQHKLGNRTEWNLFNGNGGPKLPSDRKLVEFSVASEIVLAVDNLGQFHIFKPTEFKTPTQWSTNIGCPLPEKLFMPREKKSWSFSCSLKVKPSDRRSIEFMHPDDIVHYYEDADNKKIEFGFTATAYVLSKDGRKIRYWDTGLPANFARAFTTPMRGNFIAENLSAAGSTVMIIGTNVLGQKEIWTRMFDYEINGACPGEQHTFQKTQSPTPDRVLGLLEARRKLPLPGWRKMPPILLQDGEVLSNKISIELTGQGNSARLLKVVGTKDGCVGYYQKMIDAPEWDFVENSNLDTAFLRMPPAIPNIDLERHDMDYDGIFLNAHEHAKGLTIKLKNFHYFLAPDEPATLEVSDENTTLSINVHINDAYTFTARKKIREELIGNKDGEAKALLGTIIIPEEYLTDTKFDYLIAIFKPFHMKMNAFEMMANDEKIILKSVQKFIDMDDDFIMKTLPNIMLQFDRKDSKPGYYENLIFENKYIINGNYSLEKIIDSNFQLLNLLDNDKAKLSRESRKNEVLSSSANIAFQVGKKAFPFTENTLIHSLRKFLPHSNLSQYFPDKTEYAIEQAKTTVQKRIRAYEAMLQ